eukprot:CAMPEP_0114587008 /NCGR_PEP_ID=MMETSP0125-20121206/10087_1 /TAXON_ID=485358 ORGANISM="Aristerostoma sp., Strain ATCC 50986" /NCGR_SAMPLE_ID=MMETSP0125 /ASSEMBLY_ACC=CAM_ASM_000245 /LENGTH=73 /DNA_ID=CAMNT_0001782727 /DNA_START=129 /DNA_END=350 /DNA_ORIENTATION=+
MAKGGVSDYVNGLSTDAQNFIQESQFFLRRCKKPDRKEFMQIAGSCAIGFAVMGAVGFIIKLLFIPINNIILS